MTDAPAEEHAECLGNSVWGGECIPVDGVIEIEEGLQEEIASGLAH